MVIYDIVTISQAVFGISRLMHRCLITGFAPQNAGKILIWSGACWNDLQVTP